jgi:thiol-disulfide isomerase/thioredoxin
MLNRRELMAGLGALLVPRIAQAKIGDCTVYEHDSEGYHRPRQLMTYMGNPLLLSFWAASCAPCIAEIPELNRIFRSHPILGLACIGRDFESAARELRLYKKRVPVTKYPSVLLLDADRDRLLSGPLRALSTGGGFAVPAFALLDASGRVTHTQVGALTERTNYRQLTDALGI